jgi:DNA-binding NtrC family response regulator
MEREHILRALRVAGGQKARAAEMLGISRPRLDRLLARHALASPRDS